MKSFFRNFILTCGLCLCMNAGVSQTSRQLVMEEENTYFDEGPKLYFHQIKYSKINLQPFIEWSPDGKLLGTYHPYGSPMSDACIWNVENGKQVMSLNNDEFFVWNSDGSYSIMKANPDLNSYSPNRHYAVKYSGINKYTVWNILSNSEICEVNTYWNGFRWSKDFSKMIYLDDKNEICVLDLNTGKIIKTISLEGKLCGDQFYVSPKNTYISLYYQTKDEYKADLKIINIKTDKLIASFEEVDPYAEPVWTDNEEYACFMVGKDVVQLNLRNLNEKKLDDLSRDLYPQCYSYDQKYLIYCCGSFEQVPQYGFYDMTQNSTILREWEKQEDGFGWLAFSPDNKKIAGVYYSSGIIFVADYSPNNNHEKPLANIRCLGPDFHSLGLKGFDRIGSTPIMFSNDGDYVALRYENNSKIKYWNIKTGEIVSPSNTSADFSKWSENFGQNGKYSASVEKSEIIIWDNAGIKEHWRIIDNDIDEETPYCSGWSPDGKYFYYTTEDRLKVCDIEKKLVLHDISMEKYDWSRSIYWSTKDWLYIGEQKVGSYPYPKVFLNISSGRLLTLNASYDWDYYHYNKNNTKYLAIDDDRKKEIRFYDLTTGQKMNFSPFDEEFSYGDLSQCGIYFSPNGRYVAVKNSERKTFKVFEMDSLREIYSYTVPKESKDDISGIQWNETGDFFSYDGPVYKKYSEYYSSWTNCYFLFDMKKMKASEQPCSPHFSPDGSYAAYPKEKGEVQIVELNTGHTQSIKFGREKFGESTLDLEWSSDSKCICYTNYLGFKASYNVKTNIEKWYYFDYELKNSESLKIIEETILPLLKKTSSEMRFVSSDGIGVVDGGGSIQLYDLKKGTLLCTTVPCSDSEYLTYTPEGFFTGTEWACHNLVYIVDGLEVTELTQLYDKLYRPDLIAAKVRGEDISEEASKVALESLLNTGTPPVVSLLNVPEKSDSRELPFTFTVKDCGGGIGTVYASVNGQVKKVRDSVPSNPGEIKKLSYTLPLKDGENVIEVYAYNSAGVIESLRTKTTVTWHSNLQIQRPDLYVLAVGINDYGGSMDLHYAVPDATSVSEVFGKQKSGLYENVHVSLLLNDKGSKQEIEAEFNKISKKIKPDDVFVFYVSGHGSLVGGDYYFITHDFADSDGDIDEYGISKRDIADYFTPIKARKNLIILDSCHSGAAIDSGARGMDEAVAIKRLVRATGQATLAASGDTQSSWEGYNGHGVFTYGLVEGLEGKADMDGDGYVSVTELALYVEREVPIIAEEKLANPHQQNPKKELKDQDFPLAGVE